MVSDIEAASVLGSLSSADVLISLKIRDDLGIFLRDLTDSRAVRWTCLTVKWRSYSICCEWC